MGRRGARLALLAVTLLPACATRPPRSRAPSPEATVLSHVPVRAFAEDRCGAGSLALVLNVHGDSVSENELDAALPKPPGGGVLSVDLLLAARQRGFDAGLVAGRPEHARAEVRAGRPAILMLRLLDLPGAGRDIFHYVVLDGFDPGRGLFRFQFGDGKARWAAFEPLEKSWAAAGHALLLVRPREQTDAELRRGVALEDLGRVEEAAVLYRSVLTVRPDSVRAWVDLGNAEARRGQGEEAEKAYRKALRISPDGRDALNNLAWLLLREGRQLEEAEALAARAADQPGFDRPLAQDTLGRIQLARGRCEAAARTFTEALAAEGIPDSTRTELLEGLGRARSACGLPPL